MIQLSSGPPSDNELSPLQTQDKQRPGSGRPDRSGKCQTVCDGLEVDLVWHEVQRRAGLPKVSNLVTGVQACEQAKC